MAGASASAPLVSTTVPLTGLYTSDAACAAQQTRRNESVAPHAAPHVPRSPRARAADRSSRPHVHASRGAAGALPAASATQRLRKVRVLFRAWRRTRLDGLDNAEGLARRQRGAHLRQLHVHHVAQLALRAAAERVSGTSRVAALHSRAVARAAFGQTAQPLQLMRAETLRLGRRRLPRRAAGALAARRACLRVVGDANGADVTLHLHPLRSGAARARVSAVMACWTATRRERTSWLFAYFRLSTTARAGGPATGAARVSRRATQASGAACCRPPARGVATRARDAARRRGCRQVGRKGAPLE